MCFLDTFQPGPAGPRKTTPKIRNIPSSNATLNTPAPLGRIVADGQPWKISERDLRRIRDQESERER